MLERHDRLAIATKRGVGVDQTVDFFGERRQNLPGDAPFAVAEKERVGIKRLFKLVESFGQWRYVKRWG
jgi:hypothetical protein